MVILLLVLNHISYLKGLISIFYILRLTKQSQKVKIPSVVDTKSLANLNEMLVKV